MADQWYYARDNQQQGPVSLVQLRGMLAQGAVRPTDLVWTEGMPQWRAANAVPELGDPTGGPGAAGPASQTPATSPFGMSRVGESPTPTPDYGGPRHAPGEQVLGYAGGATGGPIQFTPRALDLLRQTRPWARLMGIVIIIGALLSLLAALPAVLGAGAGGQAAGFAMGFLCVQVVFAALYCIPGVYLNRYASRIGELEQVQREDVLEQAIEAQKSFFKFVGVLTAIALGLVAVAVIFGIIASLAA